MQNFGLVSAVLLLVLGSVRAEYKYTLPGSASWPGPGDWNGLKALVEGDVFVRRVDAGYNLTELYEESSGYFNRRNGYPQPAAIARPVSTEDVQYLMLFAKTHMLRVAVYNTGHHNDVRNTADNALLIHMTNLKSVSVSFAPTPSVTVGGGANFDDVVPVVYGWTNGSLVSLSGTVGSVGVWGWAVGGGLGPLTRMYGLGVDAILSVTVVTAEGAVVTATADNEHSDLLWAIKGGAGPAFGIGVSITLKLFPSPGNLRTHIGMYYQMDATSDRYAAAMQTAPNNAWAYYLVTVPGLVRILSFCAGGEDCDAFMASMASMPACLKFLDTYCHEFPLPYPFGYNAVFSGTELQEKTQWAFGGTRTEDLEVTFREVNKWTKAATTAFGRQCWAEAVLGGVSATMDPDSTSTSVSAGMRQSHQYLVCVVTWSDDLPTADVQAAIDNLHAFEEATLASRSPANWVYWNEPQHRFNSDDDWKIRYWGSLERYATLLAVKLAYDPTNFMTCHHCVGWDFAPTVDPNLCPNNACSCSNNPTGECSVFEEDL